MGQARVARDRAVLERVPQRGTVTLEHRRVLAEGELGAPDEIQEVVDALRLRLRVAHERGAQAPVLDAGTFGELDESSEGRRFDVGGHGSSVRRIGLRRMTGPRERRRAHRTPIAHRTTREIGRCGDAVVRH